MNEPSNSSYDLPVTGEEVFFLLNGMPPAVSFPQGYDSFTLSKMPNHDIAGGLEFRLKVIALYRYLQRQEPPISETATFPLELTVGELWMLDTMMSNVNLIQAQMFNGTPVRKLATKVWDCLLEAYAYDLDERYLPVIAGKIKPLTNEQQEFLKNADRMLGASE